MNASLLPDVAQSVAGRLLNTTVEGILLAAAVWALLSLFGKQNSRTRFVIWFLALLAIAALPLLAGPHAAGASRARLSGEITLPASIASYLLVAWAFGIAVSMLRVTAGLWRVRQLRERCLEMDLASLDPAIARRLQEYQVSRRVKLCVSREVSVPTAIGFFRPAVIFPASLVSQLSCEEMDVILLHELAHLRRRDDWTNLAQKIVKAVFFFHPAVWWIENRLALEREMACDDIVLAEKLSPKTYASLLISFTEKLQRARSLALVNGLVSRFCQLSLRVAEILDAKQRNRSAFRKPLLALSAGLFATTLVIAPSVPQLVAFGNRPAMRDAEREAVKTKQPEAHPGFENVSFTSAPKVIPAVFHPNVLTQSVTPALRTSSKKKTRVVRVKAQQPRIASPAIYVVLQQAEYDESGSGVFTICIWRVEVGTPEMQLESASARKI